MCNRVSGSQLKQLENRPVYAVGSSDDVQQSSLEGSEPLGGLLRSLQVQMTSSAPCWSGLESYGMSEVWGGLGLLAMCNNI